MISSRRTWPVLPLMVAILVSYSLGSNCFALEPADVVIDLKHKLKGHTGVAKCLAFSPDGKRLASASWDGTAKVWDVATGKEALSFDGHKGRVWSAAFSPDGKRVATAGYDGTVKVWNAATGKENLTFKGHNHLVLSVAFSPDGKRLASSSFDHLKVCSATTGNEQHTFERTLWLDLLYSVQPRREATGLGQLWPDRSALGRGFWRGVVRTERTHRLGLRRGVWPNRQAAGFCQLGRNRQAVERGHRKGTVHPGKTRQCFQLCCIQPKREATRGSQ